MGRDNDWREQRGRLPATGGVKNESGSDRPAIRTTATRRTAMNVGISLGTMALPGVRRAAASQGSMAGASPQPRPLTLEYGEATDNEGGLLPLPPSLSDIIGGGGSDPTVTANPGARECTAKMAVSLANIGSVIAYAVPKLGTDLPVDESGKFEVSVRQSVTGRSVYERTGDGTLGLVNVIYPRLCVEDTANNKCVNGFVDPLKVKPHAKIYGIRPSELIEIFGDDVIETLVDFDLAPDIVTEILAGFGARKVAEFFEEDQRMAGTDTIDRVFDFAVTFDGYADREYRLWHSFDVLTVALGSPERDLDWGALFRGEYGEALPDWDGHVENEVVTRCNVEELTYGRIGDPEGPPPSDGNARRLRVTKQGAGEGRGAYFITTDGTIKQAVDSEAVIVGSAALDWVGAKRGVDNLRLTGTVTNFVQKGPATIYHNGQRTSETEFGVTRPRDRGRLSNTLTVESMGTKPGVYGVTVSGDLERGEDSEAAIRGTSALDWVGAERGVDELRYSGEITTLVLKGDARMYRNGERIYPPIAR